MRLTKKLGWVVALCSLVALGACVQSPKGGDSIIGRDPGALTQEQGVAYCYRVCHQGFPSAGYGPWDASGWYSQAGTPLVTTPQYLGLSPAQQAAAVLSTWQHPGWGMTPEPFDTGLKVWYLDTTLLKSVDPALPRFFFRSANSLSATHFGELWVTNEADQVTIFNPPMGSEGESRRNGQFWLVDMQFNPPNTGVVNSSAPGACTASCHRSHPAGGIEINRQWWEGAHNLRLKGPIIEYVTNFPSSYTSVDLTEEIVTAPLNWHSNDHNDFNLIDKTRSYCLNCHASQGLADVLLVDGVPSSMTTMTWFGPGWSGGGPWSYPGGGGLITCNGCHDGQGYPTASDQRLRFKGTIRVMGQLSQTPSKNFPVGTIEGLGNSALCAYCHQGRSGWQGLVQWDIANAQRRVRNRHDGCALATFFPGKGLLFEIAGQVYSRNEAHLGVGCVGCHMAPGPAGSFSLGGHSFMVKDEEGRENLAACQPAGCHPTASHMGSITNHSADWDGVPETITAEEEFARLYTVLRWSVLSFPNTYSSGSLSGAWLLEGEGGRLGVTSSWVLGGDANRDNAIRIAAYNYQTLRMDQGGWAHNGKYAVQIMRDTINYLRFSIGDAPLGGVRP